LTRCSASGRTGSLHPTYLDEIDAQVRFEPAPGDRGTEIHVTLEH